MRGSMEGKRFAPFARRSMYEMYVWWLTYRMKRQ